MCNKNRLSIIVYSCLKNADMWTIFLQMFRKYWSTCPYSLVLVTDRLPEDYYQWKDHFDQVIQKDATWSEMILEAIDKVNTQYVMLCMDDYLLCDQVINTDIELLLNKADQYHVASLMLTPNDFNVPIPYSRDKTIGLYRYKSAYSISTQVGIWNTQFLRRNIKIGWSAWDFERKGSLEICDNQFRLMTTLDYSFPYIEGIRKGKWMDAGRKLCEMNHIRLDYQKHPAMTKMEMAMIYFKGAVLDINPTMILKIQNILYK